MQRILLCRGGALGDLILTLPVFAGIRSRWPNAHVCYAGYLPQGKLILAGDLADEFVSLDSADVAEWFAPDQQDGLACAEWLSSFNLVVTFIPDEDGLFRRRLERAGIRSILYRSPIVDVGHAADYFMGILEGAAGSNQDGTPTCAFPHLSLHADRVLVGRRMVENLGRRVIAMHPGSGSRRKNWPLRKFAELSTRVRESGLGQPILVLGEAESDAEPVLQSLRCDTPVLKGIDITDLAGFLGACAAYVGNDSGVTHLAAALGIPVIGLFGGTDPAIWAPRGRHVHVLRRHECADGVPTLEVSEVLQALQNLLCGAREHGQLSGYGYGGESY